MKLVIDEVMLRRMEATVKSRPLAREAIQPLIDEIRRQRRFIDVLLIRRWPVPYRGDEAEGGGI